MKEILAQDISETVKNFFKDTDDQYTGQYIGIVLDNKDPEQFGRCRVRVHGLHDEFLTEDIPWALPIFPNNFSIKGSFMVPEIGTLVYVKFDDSDVYEPYYFGKVIDRENLNFEADITEDYPDSVVLYETKNGDYQKINRAKGEYIIKTGAGVFQKYSENGDVELTNTATENGDLKINVKGNITIDGELGNFKLSSQTHSTSAFSDVTLQTNGGILTQALDNIEYKTNREFDVTAGERIVLNARDTIKTESISNKILANTVSFLPSTSGLSTIDTEGILPTPIPQTFTFEVGNDILKTPILTVTPDPLAPIFNILPFDPITGALHGGRSVTGIINPSGFLLDDAEKNLEITKQKAIVEEKYVKLEAQFLVQIASKYASIDSQAQLLLATITNNPILLAQKTIETAAGLASLESLKKQELNNVDVKYGNFLTEPIFGTKKSIGSPEYNRVVYNSELTIANETAKLDLTGKTRGEDIIGPGNGIIGV